MIIELSDPMARRLRLLGQSVLPPQPSDPRATAIVTRQVCGLQAQDIFAAGLGVRVRSRGATLAEVEQARFVAKSVVWTWAMRGTLHLVAAEDLDWLLAAVSPTAIAATRNRRLQLGLDDGTYERGLDVVRRHLEAHGPSTREELGATMQAAGLPAGYSAERHLLHRAALEGIVCMGPDRGADPTFVLLEEWLGRPLRAVDPEIALATLVSRYLAAYAPATLTDLATWSGLPIGALRSAWDRVAAGMAEVTVQGRSAWTPRGRLEMVDTSPVPTPHTCLLPPFDTYLLGHRDRALILSPEHAGRILVGGIIKAAVLVEGAVAGVWQPNRTGRRVRITVDPFAPLPSAVQEQVAAEIADIDRFLASDS